MTTLAQTLFDEMESHGRDAYPEECVGALIGQLDVAAGERSIERRVERLFRIDNRSTENRKRRFQVGPQDYLAAERAADRSGKTLLGFYHSHPEHPAQPSQTDLDFAQPNFVYIIVSIRREQQPGESAPAPRATEAGAFVLGGDPSRFEPDALEIFSNA